jgi:hypothetical protein
MAAAQRDVVVMSAREVQERSTEEIMNNVRLASDDEGGAQPQAQLDEGAEHTADRDFAEQLQMEINEGSSEDLETRIAEETRAAWSPPPGCSPARATSAGPSRRTRMPIDGHISTSSGQEEKGYGEPTEAWIKEHMNPPYPSKLYLQEERRLEAEAGYYTTSSRSSEALWMKSPEQMEAEAEAEAKKDKGNSKAKEKMPEKIDVKGYRKNSADPTGQWIQDQETSGWPSIGLERGFEGLSSGDISPLEGGTDPTGDLKGKGKAPIPPDGLDGLAEGVRVFFNTPA